VVTGRFIGGDGKPAAGKPVRLFDLDEESIYRAEESFSFAAQPVLTDSDGRFRAEGVVPGRRYRLERPLPERPRSWTTRPGEVEDLGELHSRGGPD
jgi:hypothetical protein